jgi:formate C-acetyltransferase
MGELLEAVDADFEGEEAIRQLCLNAPKYGNNDPYADSIGHDIEEMFIRLTRKYKSAFGGELDIRYVSITAHVPFGAILSATPDGRKAGEPISEGVSPSQGVDRKGPTATLTSIARTRAAGYKERAARLLNMKVTPSAVAGPEGTKKLMSLIRTACDLKMWHLQFNIINRETLLAAQADPEKYRDLLVRVAGYSAYFVDLSDENLGLVFNIQKFSLHDGTGIRTLVFLKGCPLACKWCSNPEGRAYSPELAYNAGKCIGVGECDRCKPVCKRLSIEGIGALRQVYECG